MKQFFAYFVFELSWFYHPFFLLQAIILYLRSHIIQSCLSSSLLLFLLKERGIKVEGSTSNGSALERLKAQSSSQPQEGKVYLDDNNQLHWPVYFLYPEYNQSDFIEDFCESSR